MKVRTSASMSRKIDSVCITPSDLLNSMPRTARLFLRQKGVNLIPRSVDSSARQSVLAPISANPHSSQWWITFLQAVGNCRQTRQCWGFCGQNFVLQKVHSPKQWDRLMLLHANSAIQATEVHRCIPPVFLPRR